MKVHTLSVVIGGKKCNANCPYCISKMTPDVCKENGEHFYTQRFRTACELAKASGVTTALLTGKGEPTLYEEQLLKHIGLLNAYFPIIELQTNGILIAKEKISVKEMAFQGLTTVAISVVHHNPVINSELLSKSEEYDFWTAVDKVHEAGLSVRLSCILTKGLVDNPRDLLLFVEAARAHGVEQVTFRSVNAPDNSLGMNRYYRWVKEHQISENEIAKWEADFKDNGAILLLNLPHNGRVYDYNGQNVCFYTCLTESTSPDDIRQLIYFPDGHLRYSWAHKGAILF